jgi:hypothetical protein
MRDAARLQDEIARARLEHLVAELHAAGDCGLLIRLV